MKKIFIIILCVIVLFQCGCESIFSYYTVEEYGGIWESENPKMRIVIGCNPSPWGDNSVSIHGTPVWGDYGVLINDDGTKTKIIIKTVHGQFGINKYQENENGEIDISEELFRGTFTVKKYTFTLKTVDGQKIVLKRISKEIPTSWDYFEN